MAPICPDCARRAQQPSYSPSRPVSLPSYISDIMGARLALDMVKRWLPGKGIDRLGNVYVQLVSLPDASGESVLGTGLVRLNYGEETTWALGVLTHECGHHFLWNYDVPEYPADLMEGFCHETMWNFFQDMDTSQSRHLASSLGHSGRPKYDDGFRRVHAASQRIGFRRFVEQVKQQHRIAA